MKNIIVSKSSKKIQKSIRTATGMKEVVVYHEETKEFVETGNRRWGSRIC